MTTTQKSLAARLLAVRKSVDWVQKDGRNEHQRFSYASSTGVLSAVKGALDSEGVLLIPSVVRAERSDRTTKSGGTEILTEIWLQYRIINADDPADSMTIEWYGQGLDTGERGVGKALTYGEKYLILKLLQIPTDDADPDAEDRQAAPSPKQQQQQQQKAPPKATGADRDDPDAITKPQQGKIWHRVRELLGEEQTDDQTKAAIDEVALRVAGVTRHALTKKQASAVIEWLTSATPESFRDDIPF
jgi:hypothetical protein